MRISKNLYALSVLAIGLLLLPAVAASAENPPKSLGLEELSGQSPEMQAKRLHELLQDPTLPRPGDNENYNHYQQALRNWVGEKTKDAISKKIPEAVKGKTTAVSTADGFADRVTDTIADFLPLLGLSMDAVSTSEDKKSVTVKLNSSQHDNGVFGLTATATKPELFMPLSDAIKESARDKESTALHP